MGRRSTVEVWDVFPRSAPPIILTFTAEKCEGVLSKFKGYQATNIGAAYLSTLCASIFIE